MVRDVSALQKDTMRTRHAEWENLVCISHEGVETTRLGF